MIRILDLAALRSVVEGAAGYLLSDSDIRLASQSLPLGAVGVVLVTEDRRAEPLPTATRHPGGGINAVIASRVAGWRLRSPTRMNAKEDDDDATARHLTAA